MTATFDMFIVYKQIDNVYTRLITVRNRLTAFWYQPLWYQQRKTRFNITLKFKL